MGFLGVKMEYDNVEWICRMFFEVYFGCSGYECMCWRGKVWRSVVDGVLLWICCIVCGVEVILSGLFR